MFTGETPLRLVALLCLSMLRVWDSWHLNIRCLCLKVVSEAENMARFGWACGSGMLKAALGTSLTV